MERKGSVRTFYEFWVAAGLVLEGCRKNDRGHETWPARMSRSEIQSGEIVGHSTGVGAATDVTKTRRYGTPGLFRVPPLLRQPSSYAAHQSTIYAITRTCKYHDLIVQAVEPDPLAFIAPTASPQEGARPFVRTDAVAMAALDAELQDKLDELQRELEVCLPHIMSTQQLNALVVSPG